MNLSPETRPSLLLRLKDADNDIAWREFLAIYQPVVYRLARRHGLQDSDAQDVTQTVMLRVANQVHRWNPDRARGSFRGWLATVAKNLAINILVQQSRQARPSGDTAVHAQLRELPARPSTEQEHDQEYMREYRRQAFQWAAACVRPEFRPHTWEAFWLTCVGGHSIPDVARQLGMSVGAVYVARSRCMARLRQQVLRIDQEDSFVGAIDPSEEPRP